VAGWQVKLQLFTAADKIPACGPGLDYMLETLPFAEMLAKVFRGSGECAEITWRLLGLPMPVWSLVFFVGIAGVAMWLASRRPTRWLYR
jgi:disulfide bond formation protein DsbB